MNLPFASRSARALASAILFAAFAPWATLAQTTPGYRVARLDSGQLAGDLYEGGEGYFILEKLTALDLPSVAQVTIQTVTIEESIFLAGSPAIPGEDFTPATAQIDFAPGQATARVPIAILNDSLPEDLREFIKIRHPRGPADPELIDEFAAILDNEFNPLPARPLCLGSLTTGRLSRLLPLGNGKLMAMVISVSPTGNTELLRFTSDGEPDPTFSPAILGRAGIEMHEIADGKLLVLDAPGDGSYRLRRFNADGAIDASFAPFSISNHVPLAIPAPDGKVFVTEPRTILRLNTDGSVDPTFARPTLNENINSGVVAPDGSLYITGQFQTVNGAARPYIAHLSPAGVLDPAFAPTGRAFPITFWNGAPHIAQDATLYRLTPTGARDPDFTPIPLPNSDRALHVDPQGRFYRLHYSQGWIVQRFTPQGAPDPEYFRGAIQTPLDSPIAWIAQGSAYMMGQIPEINGVPMRCGADSTYTAGLAKIDLNPPPATIQIEPGQSRFIEGAATAAISLIRTGNNAFPSNPIRYRLRNGSAIAGRDFQAQPTGQFSFAAGSARHTLPIQIFNDTDVEQELLFYIDFLREDDSVFATGEFSILSDDVGVKILRKISGAEWELIPLVGDSEWAVLKMTADFQTWSQTILPANQPFRAVFSQPRKFFICLPWDIEN